MVPRSDVPVGLERPLSHDKLSQAPRKKRLFSTLSHSPAPLPFQHNVWALRPPGLDPFLVDLLVLGPRLQKRRGALFFAAHGPHPLALQSGEMSSLHRAAASVPPLRAIQQHMDASRPQGMCLSPSRVLPCPPYRSIFVCKIQRSSRASATQTPRRCRQMRPKRQKVLRWSSLVLTRARPLSAGSVREAQKKADWCVLAVAAHTCT